MGSKTVNVHIHDDDEFTVKHTSYDGLVTRDPYVSLTIEGVTFFIRNPVHLFEICAQAAEGAGELVKHQGDLHRARAEGTS